MQLPNWSFLLRKLLSNPMAIFVYGIIGKWYVMICIAALVVTFWVFKGLEQSGLMTTAKNVVAEAFEETKAVAKYCTPKLTNLKAFWDCLDNPPKYQPSRQEELLEKNLDINLQEKNQTSDHADPYDK